jgi:hypothetical protein
VELIGVKRERRAVPDAARVRRHAARYIEQADSLRRPRPWQQLGEQAGVTADGRANLIPDDALDLLPPRRRSGPALRRPVSEHRVAFRVRQMILELPDDVADQGGDR